MGGSWGLARVPTGCPAPALAPATPRAGTRATATGRGARGSPTQGLQGAPALGDHLVPVAHIRGTQQAHGAHQVPAVNHDHLKPLPHQLSHIVAEVAVPCQQHYQGFRPPLGGVIPAIFPESVHGSLHCRIHSPCLLRHRDKGHPPDAQLFLGILRGLKVVVALRSGRQEQVPREFALEGHCAVWRLKSKGTDGGDDHQVIQLRNARGPPADHGWDVRVLSVMKDVDAGGNGSRFATPRCLH